ncbi:MAG TPA: PQQ-binding-like beta-propeller repeat protein [Candidatus Polarisedimenticolia bacterium]|nr:PQQ-binding-like beta-propeller repeat protein [Candidatus Polarisedimenticolia bacterium]
MNRHLCLLALAAGGLCAAAAAATASPAPAASPAWPSWRGPLHTGLAPSGDPPVEWSETKNVRFKVGLPGLGHATPIVWGDRIYLLAAVTDAATPEPEPPAGKAGADAPGGRRPMVGARPESIHKFTVLALDRATGKTIWSRVVRETVPNEAGHVTASQASASPITDGERIYASFGSYGLYALDMNGKVLWEKDLGDMKTRNEFGEGTSPALHDDTLIVNWDHEGDDFIVALDKRTGEQRWKTAREEPTSWSTPLVVDDGGRSIVIVSATEKVRAYDLKTGEVIWTCGGLGLNCIPTPVASDGLVFVMSGYREPAGMAIRFPGAKGDLTGSERVAWRITQGTSYVSSPLLYDGKLYFLDRLRASVSCHDFKTGKAHYSDQRLGELGNVYASLVGAAGRVYALDRAGKSVVFPHGETFSMLATNQLDDHFDASPVIVGDTIYLRGHKNLYAVGRL